MDGSCSLRRSRLQFYLNGYAPCRRTPSDMALKSPNIVPERPKVEVTASLTRHGPKARRISRDLSSLGCSSGVLGKFLFDAGDAGEARGYPMLDFLGQQIGMAP